MPNSKCQYSKSKKSLIGLVGRWLLLLFSAQAFSSTESSTFLASAQPSQIAKKLTPIDVQLNWNHQFQFAGFYAALQQGYYRDAGLAVEIKGWKPGLSVLDEVVSKRADFGVGYSSIIADYAQGTPIKLVMATFQFSPMVLLSHEPITELTQLSGKKVMHFGNLQIRALIEKASGLVNQPIQEIPSSGDLQDFINHQVDFYAAYITNEPYRLSQSKTPFFTLDPKSYGIQSYGDLVFTHHSKSELQPDQVIQFRDATIAGWKYAITHQAEIVDFIIQNYPVVKSRDALLAEAKVSKQYVQTGKTPIGQVDALKLIASVSTAKELGLISQAELSALDIQDLIFDDTRPQFTEEELAYLKAHPVIKLANDRDWAPFEFEDPKKGFSGMSADYFKLFEQKLGVRFQPIFSESWESVTELTKRGDLDVFSCAVATPERQTYMRFTEPYLSFPMALASNDKITFVSEYQQLEDYTIAVVKDYWSHELLKSNYPNIKLLTVETVQEGLSAVLDGRADGYLGNLAVINYTIRKYGLEGVRIVGQFAERFELAIGVQKNDPLLFSILQKTLNSVTQEQRDEIYNRWVTLKVVNELNLKQLLQIFIPVFLVIGALLFLVVVYSYQKRQQKAYIAQIHDLSYATAIDFKTQKIIWSSQSFAKFSGYSEDELIGMPYLKLSCKPFEDESIQDIYKALSQCQAWRGEMRGQNKAGEDYWVDLTLTPTKDIWGNVSTILATRIDITDKKRVEQLSIIDELTGLYNRRYYNKVIESELRRAKREHYPLAIAILDIDLFKLVNDSYGHQHGDQVLHDVARQLELSFNRANDFVFRVGGEEFLAISSFETELQFQQYLEQLCVQIEGLQIENIGSPYGVVTISIGGLYLHAGEVMSFDELFRVADKMLYAAKEQGRNQVVMFKS